MKKLILKLSIIFILIFSQSYFSQQVTGLSGWDIYLDPGHSQKENMGIYNYSEAEKNLRVGLNLRQMLLDWTDIDTVYICREDDNENVSLSQRTDEANSLGAAWYHSIHSDASGNTSTNSTLLLYGGWRENGQTVEKNPNGGKAMGDIMVDILTRGMRTTTRGNYADRTFYQGFPFEHENKYPYLHVNRETTMPSELSEAGFHTNPTQNQLNMNDKWKRLEAKTFFWSILKYHNIARPFVGTVVGIIKDIESSIPINGAIVELNGQKDTTDTFESLFHLYTNDPNLLHNGFYYLEDIPAGTLQMKITAPDYDSLIVDVTTQDTFFTFKDISLISKIPPTVISTIPTSGDSLYPGIDNITIKFSRPMDKDAVQNSIQFYPTVNPTFNWTNGDRDLIIKTDNFAFNFAYEITIYENAKDKYNHSFDGNGDGISGDPFTFSILTKVQDISAPQIVYINPSDNNNNVELKPIINVAFNEIINTASLSGKFKVIQDATQTNINGIAKHYIVNNKSVLNFFITTTLPENQKYIIKLLPGIEDKFGNSIDTEINSTFTTGNSDYVSQNIIDNFDNGIAAWWQPTASGSTIGVIPDSTKISSVSDILNHLTGSLKSMKIEYAYDTTANNWLIREYRSVAQPSFDKNLILQAFVFGDGENNKFRFAIKETSTNTYEVSPWFDVNWLGWKLVSWDLSQGETGQWLGNGILEPPFIFDSFQMTFSSGNKNSGIYYFDDLRTALFITTDIEQEDNLIPEKFALYQNYPNPFNPSTKIKFSIPKASNVRIIIRDILGREVDKLVDNYYTPGNYSILFNASNYSSGIYFYELLTDQFHEVKKMILVK
ncbi:MAG: hypothetical protein STSR0008_09760 [Ignavibacterium sp.]